ncbi:5-histidylcysteine sulfoxide synthase [uncultured Desulfuromonas sp.]|uniref:5-histidylcysteine sulfoxide synthase n=1 Tax=uncultured Desulfuromonas sp. TaxID=181013 RepID=UPI002AAB0A8E|nr:5-histidylcysteine sulfoxide synthase [uncultured Desulfuromonas sp.]
MIERTTLNRHHDPALKAATMPALTGDNAEKKRQELLDYFRTTYAIEEALFDTLRYEESFYRRADPLRHPLVFYYGHTAAFYINKLVVARLITQRINPRFESIFAIGVDEMSWDDLDETHYDWPTVSEVTSYRRQVKEQVETLITTLPLELPITWESPWWALVMGMEHQRIHLETSSVLIRQLPLELLCEPPLWQSDQDQGSAPENTLRNIAGGEVTVGRSLDSPYYGWDCEYGAQSLSIEPFAVSQYLVSNGEYLTFVEQNGYSEQRWWSDEGWRWCQYQQATMPRFWRQTDEGYRLRTMLAERPMPWNWPVEVNFLEAKAFCNWKAAQSGQPLRLPSEAEWLHWHDQINPGYSHAETTTPANINLNQAASSCPVDRFTRNGFGDVIGNVWQWTETAVDSLPGFRIHPYYDDFSTPTFDSLHNVIKGGSWISTGNEATREARYAFRRHFYQHAGFRYIASDQPLTEAAPSKESDPLIARLCHDHYGNKENNFMQQLAELAIAAVPQQNRKRALQVGCEAGRGTFELARAFDEVIGVDLSANIIRRAVEMAENGHTGYQLIEEGELISHHEVTLEGVGLASVADKVSFLQADPCNLKPQYHGFDLIVVSQILERLYDPGKFLDSLSARLNPGGMVVVASSYDWDDQRTDPHNRIGGQRIDGEPVNGPHALADRLKSSFDLMDHHTLSRKLHRHRYSALWQQSDVTLWRKHEDA